MPKGWPEPGLWSAGEAQEPEQSDEEGRGRRHHGHRLTVGIDDHGCFPIREASLKKLLN
jgi:hypothetical protein